MRWDEKKKIVRSAKKDSFSQGRSDAVNVHIFPRGRIASIQKQHTLGSR